MTLEQGQVLPEQVFRVTRADLVRYAGASGDFNPIHWSERVATGVGLPGVIAHGMFTMALAGRAVTAWAGSADAVVDFGVRFTRPVPVPDTDEGTTVSFTAVVKAIEDGLATLELTAMCGGEKVLAQARAKIKQA
ncbi:MAG TPA: MaoC family dehydratase [Candidatus Limnocylindrales bacterium]